MANTSASGGYLAPSSTTPIEDNAFEDFVCNAVAGVTGLVRDKVRPRWQPKPPPQPDIVVDWCGVGIVSILADYGTAKVHRPEVDGTDELQRHDTVELLASFYGPQAFSLASRLRDGLMVDQNREALRAGGVAILECTRMRTASDLVNERWVRRVDLDISLRRAVVRVYPILNLLSANGSFETQYGGRQTFTVEI